MREIKFGICGITGKVGRLIASSLKSEPGAILIGGTSRQTPLRIPLANILEDAGLSGKIMSDEDLFAHADVVIDFSSPEALPQHLTFAQHHKCPLMIGTTGLTEAHYNGLEQAAANLPIIQTSNTSLGVTVMAYIAEKCAAFFPLEYDVDIIDSHHRHKKDAPSGTAKMLASCIMQAWHVEDQDALLYDPMKEHIRPRARSVGIAVIRSGDETGSHTLSFTGKSEKFTLTHQSFNRHVYAEGAIKAARWVLDQPPGLYTMRDVLGLA